MTKMHQEDWGKEFNYADSFQASLMRAIEWADHDNLVKLEKEYPDIVAAWRKYSGRRQIRCPINTGGIIGSYR